MFRGFRCWDVALFVVSFDFYFLGYVLCWRPSTVGPRVWGSILELVRLVVAMRVDEVGPPPATHSDRNPMAPKATVLDALS